MNIRQERAFALLLIVLLCGATDLFAQQKGLRAISAKDLKYNLDFLGATEFRGRETPSPELEIATLYLGNWAEYAGLKPVMADGSFYQSVPLNVTAVLPPGTRITLNRGNVDRVYYFGKDFSGQFVRSGSYAGGVVFAGLGISEPDEGWDDLKDLDLRGKIVVILDAQKPGTTFPLGFTMTMRFSSRLTALRNRGAAAVLTIVDMERERRRTEGENIFDYIPEGRGAFMYQTQQIYFGPMPGFPGTGPGDAQARPPLPFERAEISHDLAADMLGITKDEIAAMFATVEQGEQPQPFIVEDVTARLDVAVETYRSTSRNVVAMVEGSDPKLKNEYVVVSGHHDGRGIDDGAVIAGADDNVSACVALMEIGKALMAEPPKRSVILAWFTGEENGLLGSHYFVNNCPVPVEKISACINMDMICRNDPDSLFLIGSDLLSSELDESINMVNRRYGINYIFDYKYSNLTHPQRVYFRSDQFPFVRMGIPSVWIFCGFTYDYHTEWDIRERVDFGKLYKTTRLVYLSAFDVANRKSLLKLDVNPAVTSRGKHNLTEKSLYGGR